MHRNHPQRRMKNDFGNMCFRTHRHSRNGHFSELLAQSERKIHPTTSFTTSLNPRRRPLGRRSPARMVRIRAKNNNSRSDKSAERRDLDQSRRTDSDRTRPETHQNLIHSNKEQRHPTGQHPQVKPKGMRHDHTTQDALPRHMIKPNSNIRDTDQSQPACPSLPTRRVGQRLSSFARANDCRRDRTVGHTPFAAQTAVVETIGIEPMTPCLQSRCSPS